MRIFAALLLAVVPAIHGAGAGPRSWPGADTCEVRIESASPPRSHLLLPASVLEASAAESARDGAEGMGGCTSRLGRPQDDAEGAVYVGPGASGDAVAALTRSCLLGFRGHPSTAPPSRS